MKVNGKYAIMFRTLTGSLLNKKTLTKMRQKYITFILLIVKVIKFKIRLFSSFLWFVELCQKSFLLTNGLKAILNEKATLEG